MADFITFAELHGLEVVSLGAAVLAVVFILLPVSSKPIAGIKQRRQSIISAVVAILSLAYANAASWELFTVLSCVLIYTILYVRNHNQREKIKADSAQLKAQKDQLHQQRIERLTQELAQEASDAPQS